MSDSRAETKKSRGLFSLPNDDPRKIVVVAVALCLVCSVAVSSAAVLLRPLQERNKELALKSEILKVAGLYRAGVPVEEAFSQIETRIVDLATGEYAEGIDPETYSQRAAARDPALSVAVPPEQDIASIKRRADYAPVYLVRDNGRLKLVVLPVHGYGLWSTMYGLVALEGDARTIAGLTFYEQAETAGLGAEVSNPSWLAQWQGKLAVDEQGRPEIRVIKGSVAPNDPQARYEVDGLAGATLTSNGVTHLMHYWLGEQGFGPYLQRIRERGA